MIYLWSHKMWLWLYSQISQCLQLPLASSLAGVLHHESFLEHPSTYLNQTFSTSWNDATGNTHTCAIWVHIHKGFSSPRVIPFMLRLRRKCMSWASCDRSCIHLSSRHWIKIVLHRQVWICPKPSLGKTLSSLKIDGLPTSSHRSESWCLILVSTKSIQIHPNPFFQALSCRETSDCLWKRTWRIVK